MSFGLPCLDSELRSPAQGWLCFLKKSRISFLLKAVGNLNVSPSLQILSSFRYFSKNLGRQEKIKISLLMCFILSLGFLFMLLQASSSAYVVQISLFECMKKTVCQEVSPNYLLATRKQISTDADRALEVHIVWCFLQENLGWIHLPSTYSPKNTFGVPRCFSSRMCINHALPPTWSRSLGLINALRLASLGIFLIFFHYFGT